MDKLSDLANKPYKGRKTDPNCKNVRNELEAIQIEIQTLHSFSKEKRA